MIGASAGVQNIGNAGVKGAKNIVLDTRIVDVKVKKNVSRNGTAWTVVGCSQNGGEVTTPLKPEEGLNWATE